MVLPVSGGSFPVQMAIVSQLCRVSPKYRPDLVLGSSGGNVTAYVSLAADWCPESIERICRSLNSNLFVISWWPNGFQLFPSWFIGFFKGSSYNLSPNGLVFFCDLFSPSNIVRTEIWTGVTNKTCSKAQFFCNRTRKDSIIKADFNCGLFGCLPAVYLDGKLEDIGKVSIASAAIPTVIPAQVIADTCYSDGGSTYASPLTCMQDILHGTENHYGPGLHLTYISCIDLELDENNAWGNILHGARRSVWEMSKSMSLQDRLAAVELLRFKDERLHYKNGSAPLETMQQIEELRVKVQRTIVEYYPKENYELSLESFTGEEVVKAMEKAKGIICYRIWWIGSFSAFDQLKS